MDGPGVRNADQGGAGAIESRAIQGCRTPANPLRHRAGADCDILRFCICMRVNGLQR